MASNPIFALLWLILLLILAWPVAFFCAALWVLFMVSRLRLIDGSYVFFNGQQLLTTRQCIPSHTPLQMLLISHLRLVVIVPVQSIKPLRTLPDGPLIVVMR